MVLETARVAGISPRNYTVSITTDQELVQIVDAALAQAANLAGAHLACYPGCAVCCFGPFPITLPDAERLRQGWLQLEQVSPTAATAIARRAEAARIELTAAFPGDAATGTLNPDTDQTSFAARFPDLACPVLDPDSGSCLLYDSRPIACRLYGLLARVDGENLPHCPLCFRRASAGQIEAARAVIDMPPTLLTSPALQNSARTVIAYAIPPVLARHENQPKP